MAAGSRSHGPSVFLFVYPVLFQIGSLVIPSYGVCAAVGVLLALALAHATSRLAGMHPRHAWNMLVLAVFAALAGSRLFLIAMNLSDLRRHPRWLLAVSMVHHPLIAAVGILCGSIAVLAYARWLRLPLAQVADVFAAPLSLGLAAEQAGALLAGSDFGGESPHTSILAAITYSSDLAARWSGTPLGIPLYPVQAYAAIGALLLAAIAYAWLRISRRSGDAAGVWLIGAGVMLFVTESFRDWEGRGALFHGALDIPQLAAVIMVLSGGAILFEWHASAKNSVVHNLKTDRASGETQ